MATCQPLFPMIPTGPLPEAMDWQYPYLAASQTPIKWTVTGLQEKEKQALTIEPPLNPVKPEIRQSAMELGTLMHKLLETLDFSQKDYFVHLKTILQHLIESGFCSSELAQKVDLNMLVDFATSSLGRRVAQMCIRDRFSSCRACSINAGAF